MSTDEINKARRAICETAKAMLAGHLSYIEGARLIHSSAAGARLGEFDPDIAPFTGIVSETDALPVGEQRSLWQAAALLALQTEIDRKEAWARQFGEPHCQNLAQRLSNQGTGP